jgi:hypothetical protein
VDDRAQEVFDRVSSYLDNGSKVAIVVLGSDAEQVVKLAEAAKEWPNSHQVKVVCVGSREDDTIFTFIDDPFWWNQRTVEERFAFEMGIRSKWTEAQALPHFAFLLLADYHFGYLVEKVKRLIEGHRYSHAKDYLPLLLDHYHRTVGEKAGHKEAA